jgi:hypothetical protein
VPAGSLAGYQLVPLDCPSCGAGIAAEGGDVLYYCTACRNGYRLDESLAFDARSRRAGSVLVRVEVAFVAAPAAAVARHLPFWALPARLTVHESRGGRRGPSLFGGEAEPGVAVEGEIVVPAFDVPLATLLDLTRSLSAPAPRRRELLGERLTGGCYGPEDARKLAHWAVIATEISRSGTLEELRYDLDLGEPRLLGVPFVERQGRLADALHGVQLP